MSMKRTETTPPMPEDTIATAVSHVHGGDIVPPADPSSAIGLQEGLSPAVQKHIGNLLKVSFQDLLTEPVPDRFASLLDQLEQAEKKTEGEK